MYVNKKLIVIVTLAELRKLINWAHIMFSNLCSKLQNLSIIANLKIYILGRTWSLVQPKSLISSFVISSQLTPFSKYWNLTMKMKRMITFQ
jgi:hypothetical protein